MYLDTRKPSGCSKGWKTGLVADKVADLGRARGKRPEDLISSLLPLRHGQLEGRRPVFDHRSIGVAFDASEAQYDYPDAPKTMFLSTFHLIPTTQLHRATADGAEFDQFNSMHVFLDDVWADSTIDLRAIYGHMHCTEIGSPDVIRTGSAPYRSFAT